MEICDDKKIIYQGGKLGRKFQEIWTDMISIIKKEESLNDVLVDNEVKQNTEKFVLAFENHADAELKSLIQAQNTVISTQSECNPHICKLNLNSSIKPSNSYGASNRDGKRFIHIFQKFTKNIQTTKKKLNKGKKGNSYSFNKQDRVKSPSSLVKWNYCKKSPSQSTSSYASSGRNSIKNDLSSLDKVNDPTYRRDSRSRFILSSAS